MELPLDQILLGDCLDLLKELPDESIDSVVSDVPYGLGNKDPDPMDIFMYVLGATLETGGDFMGRDWQIPSLQVWREIYRVLKPGGHVLSFAGTRTFDLVSIGLRMAGFECRDTIGRNYPVLQWVQGQGMPKSHNVSAAIDKKLGRKREVLGLRSSHRDRPITENWDRTLTSTHEEQFLKGNKFTVPVTESQSEEAKQWEGWGSGLKPAWEPILVFRKPLAGTLASNVLKHGTGGLNIDATRVRHASKDDFEAHKKGVDAIREKGGSRDKSWKNDSDLSGANEVKASGRWPSNCVLEHSPSCRKVGTQEIAPHPQGSERFQKTTGGDFSDSYGNQVAQDEPEVLPVWECTEGCPVLALDAQSGDRPSTLTGRADPSGSHEHPGTEMNPTSTFLGERTHLSKVYADAGGASRFFTQIEADEDANKGRWPSNVLLTHAPGCERLGTKKVRGITGGVKSPIRRSDVYSEFGGYQTVGSEQGEVKGYSEPDGSEEVQAWNCVDGCPVKALDDQTGILKSGKDVNPTEGPVSGFFGQTMPYYSKDANYGDEGGASRFFTQFEGETETSAKGRWPSNVVLEHAEGCKPLGTKKVKGTHAVVAQGEPPLTAKKYRTTERVYGNYQPKTTSSHVGLDGKETVEAWECVDGCPVKALDDQSGDRRSSYTGSGDPSEVHVDPANPPDAEGFMAGSKSSHEHTTYQDSGGASRFFTQIEAEKTSTEWECAEGCPVKELGQQGVDVGSHSAGNKGETNHVKGDTVYQSGFKPMTNNPDYHADEGGVDRFFSQFEAEGGVPFRYVPKANRKEAGCDEFEVQHVTVKPLALMRWLVKLVTPLGVWVCPDCEQRKQPEVSGVQGSVRAEAVRQCGVLNQLSKQDRGTGRSDHSAASLSDVQDSVYAAKPNSQVLFDSMPSGGTEEAGADVSGVSSILSAPEQLDQASSKMVLKSVRRQRPKGAKASSGVSGVPGAVHAEGLVSPRTTPDVLLEKVWEPACGASAEAREENGDRSRLRDVVPSRAPDGDETGDAARASSSDGSAFGSKSEVDRGCSSYQRDQNRQSNRESGGSSKGGSRSVAEATTEAVGVSTLLGEDSRCRKCSRCGKSMIKRAGVVLDMYCGSGTTCHAAVLEGMHFIGMERDPASHAEAIRRLEIVLRREQERQEAEELHDFAMGRDT